MFKNNFFHVKLHMLFVRNQIGTLELQNIQLLKWFNNSIVILLDENEIEAIIFIHKLLTVLSKVSD